MLIDYCDAFLLYEPFASAPSSPAEARCVKPHAG